MGNIIISSVFYQYCDTNHFYAFKKKETPNECVMKVYDLAHTCIKKQTITLEELSKLPSTPSSYKDVEEMVGWLVKHHYIPSKDSQNGFTEIPSHPNPNTSFKDAPSSLKDSLLQKIAACTSFIRSTISLGESIASFICPLTQTVFTDPVVDEHGHTFERLTIEEWLKKKKSCPLSPEKTISNLNSNFALKQTIEELQKKANVFPQMGCCQKENDKLAQRNLDNGDAYLEEGELEEALSSYTKALNYTNKWENYQRIPPLFEKMGLLQEAALSHLYLAQYQWENGLWEDSLSHLTQASQLDENPKILALLAHTHYAFGNKDQGHAANLKRGEILEKDKAAEALLAYEEMIEQDPFCKEAYDKLIALSSNPKQKVYVCLKRALTLFHNQELKQAQAFFKEAYKLNPSGPLIHHLPFLTLLAQQKLGAVKKICLRLIAVYEKQNSTKDLIGCYKILNKLGVGEEDMFYKKLIDTYQKQKKPKKVVQWTLLWMDELIAKKQGAQAEKVCLEALKVSEDVRLYEKLEQVYSFHEEPKLLDLWMKLGGIYEKKQELENAASVYRKAYERFSDQKSLLALVAVLSKLGRVQEGVALCFKAANDALAKNDMQHFSTYYSQMETMDPTFSTLTEIQRITLVSHQQIHQLSKKLQEAESYRARERTSYQAQIRTITSERDNLSQQLQRTTNELQQARIAAKSPKVKSVNVLNWCYADSSKEWPASPCPGDLKHTMNGSTLSLSYVNRTNFPVKFTVELE